MILTIIGVLVLVLAGVGLFLVSREEKNIEVDARVYRDIQSTNLQGLYPKKVKAIKVKKVAKKAVKKGKRK